MTCRIALLQKQSLDRQPERSTELVIGFMREAAARNAALLLLPEAFLTGYELPMRNDEALPQNSPFLRRLCDEAKALRIGVVATAIAQGKVKPRNSAFVISRDGEIFLCTVHENQCASGQETCVCSRCPFYACSNISHA